MIVVKEKPTWMDLVALITSDITVLVSYCLKVQIRQDQLR